MVSMKEDLIRHYLKKNIPLWYKSAQKKGIDLTMDNYIGIAVGRLGAQAIDSIVREEVQWAVERMDTPRPGIVLRRPQNLN